ncbi:MAG TPA: C-GCAxxG-C-C family protein [Spirochaetota bacterium]|nr:C-GCAxxG-C-C family protein [Spirochaetota bacterium]HPV41299.1 C-GCAxxG-C-C family protein [Spirochaetota bacterium]
MSKGELAAERFRNGLNCSQSVLATYGPALGLDEKTCIRIASPFGGGIGHVQEVCGALSGAIMAIGLKHGEGSELRERRDRVIELTQEFIGEFKKRKGSIFCRDLLGCDITTKEGLVKAREQGAFNVCADYVRLAGELLEKML